MADELSNKARSIIFGVAIGSFFLTIVAFFTWLPKIGVDSNIFAVLSLVAAAFVSYLVITVFGIVKEFSLKGGSFEFTSKLEEVKTDVKDTKRDVASGFANISNAIQSINMRFDTAITNQFRSDQKTNVIVNNLKEAQEKATKIVADASGVSRDLPLSPPKSTPPDSKSDINPLVHTLLNIFNTLYSEAGPELDVQTEMNKAYTLIVGEKYEEALKTYDAIIARDPYNTEAMLNKGICLYYLGIKKGSKEFHKESIKMYDKVLEYDPKNVRALHMKGVACYYLGKIPLANEYYDKVLDIDPKFGLSLYLKACNLARLDKPKEALEFLRRAVSSDQRYKKWADSDTAFETLRNNPEFQKILL